MSSHPDAILDVYATLGNDVRFYRMALCAGEVDSRAAGALADDLQEFYCRSEAFLLEAQTAITIRRLEAEMTTKYRDLLGVEIGHYVGDRGPIDDDGLNVLRAHQHKLLYGALSVLVNKLARLYSAPGAGAYGTTARPVADTALREPTDHRLVYNVSCANGGLVFATPERARHISRIHDAITKSSTWEQFRRAMPREEYSRIVSYYDLDGEPRPRGSDPFDCEVVPGYSDGDYPAWLQQEMREVLPREILDTYGTVAHTAFNGSYVHIDPKHLPMIKARLGELGYEVQDGTHLSFY